MVAGTVVAAASRVVAGTVVAGTVVAATSHLVAAASRGQPCGATINATLQPSHLAPLAYLARKARWA